MTSRFRLHTPRGSFPLFATEARLNIFTATLIFYTKRPANPKYQGDTDILEADHHIEEGETQAHALEKMKAWSLKKFGEPCDITVSPKNKTV